jgi:hypothetical protein
MCKKRLCGMLSPMVGLDLFQGIVQVVCVIEAKRTPVTRTLAKNRQLVPLSDSVQPFCNALARSTIRPFLRLIGC